MKKIEAIFFENIFVEQKTLEKIIFLAKLKMDDEVMACVEEVVKKKKKRTKEEIEQEKVS